MTLDKHFDQIVILTLPGQDERARRACEALLHGGLSSKPILVLAIRGDELTPPSWWRAGNGAWGCLCSHRRAIESAWLEGVQRLLVLEDDCVWQHDAAERIDAFMREVPDDWGQIYLGGQHQQKPDRLDGKPEVLRAWSVNRTHAYAIRRDLMPRLLRHLQYAPDYIEAREVRHIDHQMEVAHRRGDWPVYAPSWWPAGQGENSSMIDGKQHLDRWWHWSWDHQDHLRLPWILIDREPCGDELTFLHFGWKLLREHWVDEGLARTLQTDLALDRTRVMSRIALEAFEMQRLPAARITRPETLARFHGSASSVIPLSQADLLSLVRYPSNGLLAR